MSNQLAPLGRLLDDLSRQESVEHTTAVSQVAHSIEGDLRGRCVGVAIVAQFDRSRLVLRDAQPRRCDRSVLDLRRLDRAVHGALGCERTLIGERHHVAGAARDTGDEDEDGDDSLERATHR